MEATQVDTHVEPTPRYPVAKLADDESEGDNVSASGISCRTPAWPEVPLLSRAKPVSDACMAKTSVAFLRDKG